MNNIFEILWYISAGAGHVSKEKLEFKHRLSIAIGAAKGDLLQNQWAFFGFPALVDLCSEQDTVGGKN